MTGIEIIAAALAAGVTAGATNTAEAVIQSAYTTLREALRRRLSGRRAEQTLQAEETDATAWITRIGDDLTDTGADTDEEILAAARHLLAITDPEGTRAGKYTVHVTGGQHVQVGDGTIQIGTVQGPVAQHISNSPMTFTYGQQPPVPPAPPATE